MKTIQITESAYQKLAHWASVSRTFDAAIEMLLELNTEQSNCTVAELVEPSASVTS